MKIIILFTVLSLINVVFSTVRSLITINGDKTAAAVINAAYFSFYNVVLIYTVADFPLWVKCVITFGANLIGVYIVKYIEEVKKSKEPPKLWKIELALPADAFSSPDVVKNNLAHYGIDCNYVEVGKWVMYNCYCPTKHDTHMVKFIASKYNGKLSAYESAPL